MTDPLHPSVAELIDRLELKAHPEGGRFRETWRAPAPAGGRGAGTAIIYLLEAGGRSHWHRIDATELWLFQAGSPLTLGLARGEAGEFAVRSVVLGPNPLAGHCLQQRVEPNEWQSAEAHEGWALVACVVVPAFSFDGFSMAPPGWAPRAAPRSSR